jgi:hypothetical protein
MGDISDSEFNEFAPGISGGVLVHPAADFDKEVAGLQFREVFIQADHGDILTNPRSLWEGDSGCSADSMDHRP